jgi:hypothetical protein
MSFNSDIVKIQRWAGVTPDGDFGPVTAQAVVRKLNLDPTAVEDPFASLPSTGSGQWHHGKASSFADPADVRAFKRCKDEGKSDQECFKVGDNGIGCWGDDTSEGSGPSCALPPDDMEEKFGSTLKAKHARVRVAANGQEVIVTLKDRMPSKRNITNGAIIDLNPDAAVALGLKPPFLRDAKWAWV